MSKNKLSPGMRAVLERSGFDARDLGKTWNRAAPSLNTDDVDRITIPTEQAELEDMLRDPKSIKGLLSQPNAFKQFITNYARNIHEKDETLLSQVKAETERVLTNWLKDNQEQGITPVNLGAATATAGAAQTRRIYNAKAMGAAIDKEFGSSAEFFQAIWHQADRTSALQAKLQRIRNAFSSTVPSEGGFLIPETVRSEILRVSLETSIVRPRARTIPMETLRVPFPAIDTTSNVSSVYGGIVGYWTEEGGALTDSSPSFSRVVLEAKKLTAYTAVPNELISDSPSSLQAFMDEVFPEALAFYEDDAFMNGNGVGMPQGFINCPASVQVSAETGQPSTTIVWENIVKMYSRMLPVALNRAVWVAAIDTFPQLATMALSVGTGGGPVWIGGWSQNGDSAPPVTILGRPVLFTEKAPALGTTGDINFVDLGFYLIGDRQVMSAMSSPHFKFQNDQTAYRVIERVDGQPWIQSAITPRNNSSNTLTPFVQLASR